jgi:hypothetical protein
MLVSASECETVCGTYIPVGAASLIHSFLKGAGFKDCVPKPRVVSARHVTKKFITYNTSKISSGNARQEDDILSSFS